MLIFASPPLVLRVP